ncbi:HTTM domain-containing protein [Streptomyces carminius]|uniref:HTTM domain-containing protein n=1 Tax=Streptomyces carminius TaxID=2665496 RepID=UPI0038CD0E7E
MKSETDRDPAGPSPAEPSAEPPTEASPGPSPEPSAAPLRAVLRRSAEAADRAMVGGIVKITARPLGPYQSAVVRIGFALAWLLYLLFEWPNRHELYGPDGPWSWELGRRLIETNNAFTALMWSDSTVWFEIVYAVAVLSGAALLVGWRTRTMSVLFMLGVLSLQNRSVFMGDGGDNVIHLMAIYLVFTRCGRVWSLDARRRARRPEAGPDGPGGDPVGVALWSVLGAVLLGITVRGDLDWFGGTGPVPFLGWATVLWGLWLAHALWWAVRPRPAEAAAAPSEAADTGPADTAGPAPEGEDRPGGRDRRTDARRFLDVLTNVVHNAALLVIMVEVCFIYATAGWYKIQGSRWQDGTALHYPLNLDYFTPWPALSEALGSNGVLVMLITYGTVIVQVAFPFTLFNRRVKNVLLAVMMLEHASIAVVLGLPFFSLAMIAADAVFLPTAFLVWLGARTARNTGRLRRFARRGERDGAAGEPAGPDGGTGSGADSPRTLVG